MKKEERVHNRRGKWRETGKKEAKLMNEKWIRWMKIEKKQGKKKSTKVKTLKK